MTSGIKTDFIYMKEYIEKQGCVLLEESNFMVTDTIKVLCSQCKKNIFTTTFDRLKRTNQITCFECMAEGRKEKLRKSDKNILDFISSTKYTYVSGKYINEGCKNIIVKDSEDYFYLVSLTQLYYLSTKVDSIRRFDRHNIFTIQNIHLWLKNNSKSFILKSDEYERAIDNKLEFQCLVCKEKWMTSWASISQGRGCPYCVGKKVGESNCLGSLYPDLVEEWNKEKNDISPFEVTTGSHKRIWWICSSCGYEWNIDIKHRTLENTGCPRCSSSKGEKLVSEFLTNKNIHYETYKVFPDCKLDKRASTFDFYISDIRLVIEYQGIQHYEPIDFAGKGLEFAKKLFDDNMIRDDYKRNYCLNNNIDLLEIPYWLNNQEVFNLINTKIGEKHGNIA